MATKKKDTTSLAPTVRKSTGMLADTVKKIGVRKTQTKYGVEETSKAMKGMKDVGGKTTAKSPSGVEKTKAQGLAEKKRLIAKQKERAKALKGRKEAPLKKAIVKKKKKNGTK